MHTKLYISSIMHLMYRENKPQHTQNVPLVRQLLCDCALMLDIYIYCRLHSLIYLKLLCHRLELYLCKLICIKFWYCI